MTPIDRFERQLPAALADLGDERTPDYLIDLLGRTARTRQRTAWNSPGRWIDMPSFISRPALVALLTAIVVVAIGGAIWITRPNPDHPSIAGGPTPAPIITDSPTPVSPTATPTEVVTSVVPEALRYTWVSAPRAVAGLSPRQRFRFTLRSSSLAFPNDSLTAADLRSDALLAGDQLEFRLQDAESTCTAGATGAYRYVLSPGGFRLHLDPVGTDACTTRSLALSGDWIRVACTNTQDACFGDLEAGTYPSQYVDFRLAPGSGDAWAPAYAALTYTVPSGWSNDGDWPYLFKLTPSPDYSLETGSGPTATHEVAAYARPVAAKDCNGTVDSRSAPTVDGLLSAITHRTGIVTGAGGTLAIGSRTASWVDIAVADAWTGTCPGDDRPGVVFATSPPLGSGIPGALLGIARGERIRVVVLDLGRGDLALILIDSTHPDRFDQLVSQAMPIIGSFVFK